MKTKTLKSFFKPFASIQNKILIDYKKLRKNIIEKIKTQYESNNNNEDYNKQTASIENLPKKKVSKTKLNSLTAGNLAKFIEMNSPRTLKKTEDDDDDVVSHVTISKANFHNKHPATADNLSRRSKKLLSNKLATSRNDLQNNKKIEPIKEGNLFYKI